LNGAELRPLTRDHSYVQQLIDSGSLTEDEAYEHPRRNVISQGMGIAPEVKPDVACFEMPLDAYTVICSDGLTDLVRKPRLIELAGEAESTDALAGALVREALAEGGKDNVTVIVLTPRVTFEE
jgi:protein phosphatase